MRYKITYFAPYNFANFECEAKTLEEGRQKRDEYFRVEGYSVMNREIKKETLK